MRPAGESARPKGRMPLRNIDRVEMLVGWALTALWLLSVLGSVLVGLSTHGGLAERARHDAVEHTQVVATLVADAPDVDGTRQYPNTRVRVDATWTAPNGEVRTGRVQTEPDTPAGTTLPIWVDHDGAPAARPLAPVEVLALAVIVAAASALTASALLGGAWALVRRATTAIALRDWERGWVEVEPRWRANLR